MAVEEIFAEYGIRFNDQELNRAKRTVDQTERSMVDLDHASDGLNDTLRDLGSAFAGYFTVDAVIGQIEAVREYTTELVNFSSQVGVSERDFANLNSAFTSVFGGARDIEDTWDVINDTMLRFQLASEEGGEWADFFRIQLGLGIEDIRRVQNDPMAAIELIIQRTEEMGKTAQEQRWIWDELASDPGVRFAMLAQGGVENYRRLMGTMDETGGRSIPQLVARNRELSNAQLALTRHWESARNELAISFLPRLTDAVNFLDTFVDGMADMLRGSHLLESALGTLGVALAGVAIANFSAWILPAVAIGGFALVALLVDDIIGMMGGEQSAIQGFVESLVGVEAAAPILTDIRDLFEGIALAATNFSEVVLGTIAEMEGSHFLDAASFLINPAMAITRGAQAIARGEPEEISGYRGQVSTMEYMEREDQIARAGYLNRSRGVIAGRGVAVVDSTTIAPEIVSQSGRITVPVPVVRTQNIAPVINRRFEIVINGATDENRVRQLVTQGIEDYDGRSNAQFLEDLIAETSGEET